VEVIMTTDVDIFAALAAPFPAEAIHWRVGATTKDKNKGIGLAYITAREQMDRLDDVVGPSEWGDAYAETPSGRVICSLAIRINGEWLVKSDGAGDTGMEGEKGGISDAFKRAGVKFGVGRYLYRLENEWYPIKPAGKSYKLASTPTLPTWALPDKLTDPQPEKLDDELYKEGSIEIAERIKPDGKGRIIKYLEELEELVGEEEAQKRWVTLLRHSDHAGGALSLGDIRDFTQLWRLSDEVKEMVELTRKVEK